MKKISILLVTFALMFMFFQTTSFAEEKRKGERPAPPTIGEPSKDENYAEGIIGGSEEKFSNSLNSTTHFRDGRVLVNDMGSYLRLSGYSSAYYSVNTIAVDVYLQVWNGSAWEDYVHVNEYKDYFTERVDGSNSVSVPGGYYYRSRGEHWISQNGSIERENSVTQYIYVD